MVKRKEMRNPAKNLATLALPDLEAQSHAKQFRLKAVECLQQADVAKHPEAQEIFKKLALGYEKLAAHAESSARHITSKRRNQLAAERSRCFDAAFQSPAQRV
jgi:hypothetical protein